MFEHLKTKPYLIAEIGINHNGSIKNAKKLIDLAKKYNFDAVKFQKRNPEISTPDYQKNLMRETPWGHLTYLEYKKKIEFSESDYLEINNYCKEKKIDWFASAWDIESQIFLKQFNCKYNKVASAMLTNIELL
jgi:N-acetylneuraminate synthase